MHKSFYKYLLVFSSMAISEVNIVDHDCCPKTSEANFAYENEFQLLVVNQSDKNCEIDSIFQSKSYSVARNSDNQIGIIPKASGAMAIKVIAKCRTESGTNESKVDSGHIIILRKPRVHPIVKSETIDSLYFDLIDESKISVKNKYSLLYNEFPIFRNRKLMGNLLVLEAFCAAKSDIAYLKRNSDQFSLDIGDSIDFKSWKLASKKYGIPLLVDAKGYRIQHKAANDSTQILRKHPGMRIFTELKSGIDSAIIVDTIPVNTCYESVLDTSNTNIDSAYLAQTTWESRRDFVFTSPDFRRLTKRPCKGASIDIANYNKVKYLKFSDSVGVRFIGQSSHDSGGNQDVMIIKFSDTKYAYTQDHVCGMARIPYIKDEMLPEDLLGGKMKNDAWHLVTINHNQYRVSDLSRDTYRQIFANN